MKFDCVVFDMDGTLTVPYLDFAAIARELRLPAGVPVLESIAALNGPARQEAEQGLLRLELAAAQEAQLAEGALDIVQRVRQAGLSTALLTRNARPAMQIVLDRFGLRFDLALAREDGPVKPSGEGVRAICRHFGVSCERTVCVGDWVYDVEAARAAGCVSVLLVRGRQLDWAGRADHVIERLTELVGILGI